MRILIVESRRLFVDPEHRPVTRSLEAALEDAGHRVAKLALPAPAGDSIEPYQALRAFAVDADVARRPDVVVALDPLAVRLHHPRRVLWAVDPSPVAERELRLAAAFGTLDRRIGRELRGRFAATPSGARAVHWALGLRADVLPIPDDDAATAWSVVVTALVGEAEASSPRWASAADEVPP